MWKLFRTELGAFAESQRDQCAVLAAALETFASLRRWRQGVVERPRRRCPAPRRCRTRARPTTSSGMASPSRIATPNRRKPSAVCAGAWRVVDLAPGCLDDCPSRRKRKSSFGPTGSGAARPGGVPGGQQLDATGRCPLAVGGTYRLGLGRKQARVKLAGFDLHLTEPVGVAAPEELLLTHVPREAVSRASPGAPPSAPVP
jgi:hypothetical protein